LVYAKSVAGADIEYIDPVAGLNLRARRIEHVYTNTPTALAINAVSTILASFIIYFPLPRDMVLLWAGGMLCILVCRYLLFLHYVKEKERSDKVFPASSTFSVWERALLLVLTINGLWWGIFGVFTFVYSDPLLYGFSGFVLGGMVAGAVATLGAFLPAFICYTLPAVCCMVTVLFWLESTAGDVMAVLTLTFAIAMLVTVLKVNRILTNNILLTLKNENLVSSLLEANSRLSATNANLECEIEERIRAEKQIEFLASHDALTGLANRRLQEERYVKAAARASRNKRRLALLFIDLDYFKDVNDSLGHPAGDRVLQIVAGRLRDSLRAEESVCRQGGDEFLLTAEIDRVAEAETIAQRIIETVRLPIDLNGRDVRIGASIGISLFPDNGSDFSQLVVKADQALYMAKREEKGHFRYYDGETMVNDVCEAGV